MPEYLYPGVYVEEVESTNKPIEGVSTSTAGFLGIAERGPTEPTLVTSFSEYARSFGKYYAEADGTQRYLAYGVEGFFQNGGKRCFIARVVAGGAAAASRADGAMQVDAIGKGDWGNRVAVKIEPFARPDGSQRFRLTVMYWAAMPPTPIVDPTDRDPNVMRDPNRREPQLVETFDDLTDNMNDSHFYERQVNDRSALVTVTRLAAGIPVQVKPPDLLKGGGDGGPLVPQDFIGDPSDAPGHKRGLDSFNEIDDISILCSPDEFGLGALTSITDALRDQCELRKDRFAILNARSDAAAPGTLVPPFSSKYAAFYYPWLNVIDPATGRYILMPPAGHVAGIYARSDTERGVHKDPANEIIRGVDSLQFNLTDDHQALLNPRGVNVLRYFRGVGNLVWGGRTVSSDPSWRYINVRRLFIFVEQSIMRSTRWVVFEINDEPLWARLRRSIGDFLTRLWMDDMLQGRTKEEAFYVKCDYTTMTQADIDNGRLICEIGIAPVKPAEFVIFRIGQWSAGADVTES